MKLSLERLTEIRVRNDNGDYLGSPSALDAINDLLNHIDMLEISEKKFYALSAKLTEVEHEHEALLKYIDKLSARAQV